MDKLRKSCLLALFAAMIWGLAFVMQKQNTVGTVTFFMFRHLIAFLVLIPIVLFFTKDPKHLFSAAEGEGSTKELWLGGLVCGVFMTAAGLCQQWGLDLGSTAGKGGFITSMYMVFVPFGAVLLFRQRVYVTTWISLFLAMIGLFLLCMKPGERFETVDLFLIFCAILYTGHILSVDYFSRRVNPVKLACMQMLFGTLLTVIPAFLTESFTAVQLSNSLLPMLYLGIFSSGIGFSLQVIAQSGADNAPLVTLFMSMESVFGVLFGALILKERLSIRELTGCLVMFAAIVISQLFIGKKENNGAKL